jgi:hypothetical protein
VILNLVSGPRNISTALMYSFAQRSDTLVLDEPFYAVYLSKTGATHPGRETVLQTLSRNEKEVKTAISAVYEKPLLFIKNMAHHMEVLEEPLISHAINVFLIRDPRQILASYAEVIAAPVMRDIGIEYQWKLFSALMESKKVRPIVVDAQLLLADPGAVLGALCAKCGLDFQQRMVHWPPGPKPYDGVWAPYWYANVHRSTGFERQPTSSRPLPERLNKLYLQAKSFYEKLLPFSIKA